MTPDERRAAHRTVPVPVRPQIILRRILLVVALLATCVVVAAVLWRMWVAGVVALVIALAAGFLFVMGMKKSARQDRPERSWNQLKMFRKSPRDPGQDTGDPEDHGTARPDADEDDLGGDFDPPVLSLPPPAGEIPDPPVFDSPSAPGQAPWHLPVSAAPSGLAADAAILGDLEVRAASMVGAGHRCEEPAGPRQDAYALGRTPDGEFLVIAVADGVSQSPRSDLGARVAVSAATRELAQMLDSGGRSGIDSERMYKVVAGEMLGTGRARGVPDKDICSILIVAVIPARPRPDGSRQIWTSWIGDVSLWLQYDQDLRRVTGTEKTGLDRNMLSAVLPFDLDRAETMTVNVGPEGRVMVMTDGLSDSLSSIAGVAQFFTRQWAGAPPHPATFLHQLCYDGPGQTDDRTVVTVWCGAAAGRQT